MNWNWNVPLLHCLRYPWTDKVIKLLPFSIYAYCFIFWVGPFKRNCNIYMLICIKWNTCSYLQSNQHLWAVSSLVVSQRDVYFHCFWTTPGAQLGLDDKNKLKSKVRPGSFIPSSSFSPFSHLINENTFKSRSYIHKGLHFLK